VIFSDFGCRRVNCDEMDEDRPRQPAHKIFSIESRF